MTNNTPTSEQEQDANELAVKVVQAIFHLTPDVIPTGWPDEITPLLATALAQTRERAEREQMERDCRAVCQYCDNKYYASAKKMDGKHWTHTGWDYAFRCGAAPIRAANAERLRDGVGKVQGE